MNDPVVSIYQHLLDSGSFGDFVGPGDITYTAPQVQTRWFDESLLDDDDRCVFIRIGSAGTGGRFAQYPFITVSVFGAVNEAATIPQYLADILYRSLLEFGDDEFIDAIDPVGYIAGPMKTESGRYAWEFEFRAINDFGIMG